MSIPTGSNSNTLSLNQILAMFFFLDERGAHKKIWGIFFVGYYKTISADAVVLKHSSKHGNILFKPYQVNLVKLRRLTILRRQTGCALVLIEQKAVTSAGASGARDLYRESCASIQPPRYLGPPLVPSRCPRGFCRHYVVIHTSTYGIDSLFSNFFWSFESARKHLGDWDAARSASCMNVRIASVDISHRCPTRTNFSRPARHNSWTAQQVVDINFAVVGILCRSGEIGASGENSGWC